MSILTDLIRKDGEYIQLLSAVKKSFRDKPLPILVNGLCDGAAEAFTVSLVEDIKDKCKCSLIVCSDEKDCMRVCSFLERNGIRQAFYNCRDLNLYNITASHEFEHERLKVLSGLIAGAYDAIVTTPDALLGYTIPMERLKAASIKLDFDSIVDIEKLTRELVDAGYVKSDPVDGVGTFTVRGGIIDVYPPFITYIDTDGALKEGTYPIRIELFGDEIDRICIFDPETQRITENIDMFEMPPAREVLLTADNRKAIHGEVSALMGKAGDDRAEEELLGELAALSDDSRDIRFADKYITLIYPQRSSLIDYFPDKTCILMRSTSAVFDRLKASEWHNDENIKSLLESGMIAPKYTEYSKPLGVFELFCDKNVTVHIDSLSYGMSGKALGGIFSFRTKQTVSYAERLDLLKDDIKDYKDGKFKIFIVAEGEIEAKNLASLLDDSGIKAYLSGGDEAAEAFESGNIVILWRQGVIGYELTVPRVAVLSVSSNVSSSGLSVGKNMKGRAKKKKGADAIMSYTDLEPGDYIVHENFGIGQYMGLENITVDGVKRDYFTIRFAGEDKLCLPVDKLDRVTKYIGAHADDGLVKLSKLGNDSWSKTKAQARSSVKDIAKELIKLYAERMRRPGYAFDADNDFQRDFEAAFEYEETVGQLDAIDDIKADMERPVPMDRLLCGDVGYGKTEVALRAAYKAVLSGKQVAILVPTTLLALQHYQTTVRRMRGCPVNIDMISRFRTAKQQGKTLRRLERGDVDIVIGTHRLLGKDVKFSDLGLLIVDEEQRFGVAQKEKLKQIDRNIDVLSLSATPIPRTLNMAMGGIRDISVLDEAPGDRLPVQTYVLEHDDLIIMDAIRKELRRGGQVFYLYNFVETIDACAARIAKEIPDAKIAVAHGKMDKEYIEEIWENMINGSIDILVSTTIIETGVDVPNANTLIVESAHRLGLSQLHQIRGRVGRSSRRAYAYFTYPKGKALTEIAAKRLEAIREYAEFGSGYKIAMRDMEIRGAGDLLGAQQHGHLDAVGYSLYIKLLQNAVIEEKGEKVEEKGDCVITISADAYIPEKYVRYPNQRMALYKRIALIETTYDTEDLTDEMIDRYGELPKPVMNLLRIALLRANALKCNIKRIEQRNKNEILIYPAKFDYEMWCDVFEDTGNSLKLVLNSEPYMTLTLKKGENAIDGTNKILEKYIERLKK